MKSNADAGISTRIELITPVITEGIRNLGDVRPFERVDLRVTHTLLEHGPASIESEFDEALSVPDTIRKALDAERNGANAIVIDCMGDPGLHACREAVTIPVLGPCQTALHGAALLGHGFAFVTVLDRLRSMIAKLVASYGLNDSYASFRAVNIPVLDITHSLESLTQALAREAIAAVREDHADVIVLGCTGFLGCATSIRHALLAEGLDVPVIDPIPLTIHIADALVKTGLSHSKLCYPEPGRKGLRGFNFPEFSPAK
jgi:allantoin racemase